MSENKTFLRRKNKSEPPTISQQFLDVIDSEEDDGKKRVMKEFYRDWMNRCRQVGTLSRLTDGRQEYSRKRLEVYPDKRDWRNTE
jgi:hypothetical protein